MSRRYFFTLDWLEWSYWQFRLHGFERKFTPRHLCLRVSVHFVGYLCRQLLDDSFNFEQSRLPLNLIWRIRNSYKLTFFSDCRFEKPSAIQQRAIAPCCKGLFQIVLNTLRIISVADWYFMRTVIKNSWMITGYCPFVERFDSCMGTLLDQMFYDNWLRKYSPKF